jgi:hypothetical protein
MNNIKEVIKNQLLTNKPNLSDSSINTYYNLLKKIFYSINNKDIEFNIDFFKEQDIIIKYLKDKPLQTKKTILASLVSINNDNKYNNKYKLEMGKLINEYNEKNIKQEKTKKQEDNWIEMEEVKKIYDDKYNSIKYLLTKKNINMKELQLLQDVIILALLGGIYIPIRRSQDYTEFKISNVDKDKDNYKDKNKLIFNKYKTAKFYNKQEITIPNKLNILLNKYIKLNPYEYLLIDNKKTKLDSIQLNQRLNKIFSKNTSVNILRHSYITDKFPEHNKLLEMKKTAEEMGHNIDQQILYAKK